MHKMPNTNAYNSKRPSQYTKISVHFSVRSFGMMYIFNLLLRLRKSMKCVLVWLSSCFWAYAFSVTSQRLLLSLSLSSSLSLSLSLSVYLSNWPLSFLWFSFAHCGQCMEKPDWAFIASFHFHWKCSPFQNAVLLFRAYSVLACVLLLRHTFNAFCMCIIFYHLMEVALSEWNSYAHLIETGLCFLFRKFLYENCFLSH